MRIGFSKFLVGVVSLACTGDSQVSAPRSDQTPRGDYVAAKVDETRRARFQWSDSVNIGTDTAVWVPAGFRGDGRNRYGAAATGSDRSEYQGNHCGVRAIVGSGTGGQNGNFNSFPDIDWTESMTAACGPRRHYVVYLQGPDGPASVTRPHQIVADIYTMSVGQSRIQYFATGTLGTLGVGLQYDDAYPPSNSPVVTRLPDVVDEAGRTVRQWRVTSRGTHRAMGFQSSKRGLTPTGTTYHLPFELTITEVPYPYPSYP